MFANSCHHLTIGISNGHITNHIPAWDHRKGSEMKARGRILDDGNHIIRSGCVHDDIGSCHPQA